MWNKILPLIFFGAVMRAVMAPLPNIEPVMLVVLLAALKYGSKAGFFTGLSTMLISDLYIGLPGPWSIYTSLTYGAVGFIAGFFPNFTSKKQLIILSATLTLFYDFVTNFFWAIFFGPLFWTIMLAGIPFSIIHIFGNVAITTLLFPHISPILDVFPNKMKQLYQNIYQTLNKFILKTNLF